MIEPMYKVEMDPISITHGKNGGTKKSYPNEGRVIEMYRGSLIGHLGINEGKTYYNVVIKGWGAENKYLDANRLDTPIHEIWKEYFKSLSTCEKWKRRLYSHRAWLAALIVSVISSAIVLSVSYGLNVHH